MIKVEIIKEVLAMYQEEYPVAHLSQEQLTKIKEMENELKSTTGEEIVLIAYKHSEFEKE
ncbi:hypothetical protein LCL95_09515 [Bacillus timonensis]|nr:hypothetical protein [Bacillus timonensis]